MPNYANAKATIAANIYTNHLGQVTAEMVKTAADAIVDTLIAGGYLYAGVAKLTPTQTNPGTPDANVFYIATEPGTYTNFGSLIVADGEVAILKYNGTWSKEVTGAATAAKVTELVQYIHNILGSSEDKGATLTLADGRINVNGTINSDSSYSRSLPFAVKKGDVISVKTSGYTSSGYAPVSKVTGAGTEEDPYVYSPLLTFDSAWASYAYIVEEDGNVAICFRKATDASAHFFSSEVFEDFLRKGYVKKTYVDQADTTLDQKIKEVDRKLASYGTTDLLASVTWTDNYLVGLDGTPVSVNGRRYVDNISAHKGDVLIITSDTHSNEKQYCPYLIKEIRGDSTVYLNDFYFKFSHSGWGSYYHIFEEDCTIIVNAFSASIGIAHLYSGSALSILNSIIPNKKLTNFLQVGLRGTEMWDRAIGSNNIWNNNLSYVIPIKPGDELYSIHTGNLAYAFLRTLNTIGTNQPDFVDGGRHTANGKMSTIAPDGTNWLLIVAGAAFNTLTMFMINGIPCLGAGSQVAENAIDTQHEYLKLWNINDPATIAHTDQEPQLVLLHFSDIHNDTERFRRVLAYKKSHPTFINDVLMSGDLAGNYFPDIKPEILSLDGFDKVLMEIGNHDVSGDGVNPGPTAQELYDTIFANISQWGVVQPSGAGESGYYPLYYYKDYPTCKIRLVVLDCMNWDATQSGWFAGVLAETLDENNAAYGYHVVGSQHYLSHDGLTGVELFNTPFSSLDTNKIEGQETIVASVNVVDTFISNGGIFACWLGGHFHSDFCGKLTTHNNQLFINIGSASVVTPAQDCARFANTPTQDLFNLVGFDYYTKTIKVMRIGSIYDRYLRRRETMCLHYGDNPRLIWSD